LINSKIIIVIRSSGERTACVAKQYLENAQLPLYEIIVSPFSKAVKRTLQLGLEKNADWVLSIDADVLIKKDGIKGILNYTQNADDDIFEIQGLVLDKFFPIKRPAGNHLFRVKYAQEAIELIPEEGTSLRPESDMMKAMVSKGYAIQQSSVLVGLHDYEQYFKDIYRKCFLQAKKHHWIVHEVENYWTEMAKDDKDFEVALLALRSGKTYGGKIKVDKDFLMDEIEDVFSVRKISEKRQLTTTEIEQIVFENELIKYKNSNYSRYLQRKMFPKESWDKLTFKSEENHKKRFYNKVLFKIGKSIEKIGFNIKMLSGLHRL